MPKEKNNKDVRLLVKKLKSGNRKAFEEIYYNLHQAIYANILKLIKDKTTAQDLLQEVFVVLWEKRKSLDSNKPLSNWLFVVSFNLSINQLNRDKTTIPLDTKLDLSPVPSSIQEKIDFELQWEILEEAVNQLSPQKKNVFKLCKLENKTYEETARELNISKHTVKEYLSLAMKSIREYIKEKNIDKSTLAALLIYLVI
ncbi:RNA polymerase sigma factor [Membranihabitans maritimus]|uniref:RNA polymerase sigma factor n=1 Tax=Membranihabitans maritimus TaxID=2904244 RepID=UPI001F00F3FD|nr:sigma-70 family RNA polymerase sigma factor [Membranihabitans maritimus]